MKIKRLVLFFLVSFILIFNAKSESPESIDGNGIILDIKTSASNRFTNLEVNAISLGTNYYLGALGYKVQEIGETYAVWIRNYEKWERNENEYLVKLSVRITGPSGIKEGAIIKEMSLNRIIQKEEIINLTTNDELLGILKNKLKTKADHLKLEADIIGRFLAKEIHKIILTIR